LSTPAPAVERPAIINTIIVIVIIIIIIINIIIIIVIIIIIIICTFAFCVKRWLRLRFNCDSTAVRLPFNCNSTDRAIDHSTTYSTAVGLPVMTALLPK